MAKTKKIKEKGEELASSIEEAIEYPEDLMWEKNTTSCAELFRMHDEKQLDIQPEFQRKLVWKTAIQTSFIDSLIKKLPIPSIFIGEDLNPNSANFYVIIQ